MKKLLFIMPLLFLICACTKQESSCKIGEYDCWDIIQDLKETKPILLDIKYEEYAKLPASQREEKRKESREKRIFSNPALEAKGLSIVNQYDVQILPQQQILTAKGLSVVNQDNGLWNGDNSIHYTLSNGINIIIDNSKKPYAIVKFPLELKPQRVFGHVDKYTYQKVVTYDKEGNILSVDNIKRRYIENNGTW